MQSINHSPNGTYALGSLRLVLRSRCYPHVNHAEIRASCTAARTRALKKFQRGLCASHANSARRAPVTNLPRSLTLCQSADWAVLRVELCLLSPARLNFCCRLAPD